jgi:hypothetical protein
MELKYEYRKIKGGQYFLYSKDSEIIFGVELLEEGDKINFFLSPEENNPQKSIYLKDFEEDFSLNTAYRICYLSDKNLEKLAIQINKILKNKKPQKKSRLVEIIYEKSPRTKKIYNELLVLKKNERKALNEEDIFF